MGYLQSKLEKKLLGHGFLDTLSLAEIVSLLRIFLLQSESPTKSRLFADMMSMLQNSLREEVAQMLLVSDLSAVKGLVERWDPPLHPPPLVHCHHVPICLECEVSAPNRGFPVARDVS